MKRFLTFFIVLILCGQTVDAVEREDLQHLYAESAVLMDAKTGRVLFEKNGYEEKAMASTTKIMTCILALESEKKQEIVTITRNAASQPEVHLGVSEGMQFYMRDLLYSLMLESHNDSAVAIAEHISGSVEHFAKEMNDKAAEIGCTNVNFVTPNGLDDENEQGDHRISAADLARIMSYCVLHSPWKEEFKKITQTASYDFWDVEKHQSFSCINRNSFLHMMDGVVSGKTGFTSKAGYCYVCALESEGRTFVVALLACGWPYNREYKWEDTKKIMEYAKGNYYNEEIGIPQKLPDVLVENGIPQNGLLYGKAKAELHISKKDTIEVLMREGEEIEVKELLPDTVAAPITKGTAVGEIKYLIEGKEIASDIVQIANSVYEKDYRWYFESILRNFLLCRSCAIM